MGNESSSAVVEDEKQFLEGLHGMSLESPDFDERVNAGTTAANCQPKHTREEEERMARMVAQAAEGGGGGRGRPSSSTCSSSTWSRSRWDMSPWRRPDTRS